MFSTDTSYMMEMDYAFCVARSVHLVCTMQAVRFAARTVHPVRTIYMDRAIHVVDENDMVPLLARAVSLRWSTSYSTSNY